MTGVKPTVGAVVLAGGFGTRLAPLTNDTPKPLLQVGGAAVVTHLIDRIAELDNLQQVVVVVNGQHLDQWNRWNRDRRQDLRVAIESNGVVTNEARPGAVVDLARGVAALEPVDWIAILAGDNLIDEPLQPHVDAAIATGQPMVLCRDLGDQVPPGRFGEITVDGSGRVVRFREKPAHPASPLAATCTYMLPGSIGERIDDYLLNGDPDSPGRFIGWLIDRQPVSARPLVGRYFDIGNHDTLADARQTWSER